MGCESSAVHGMWMRSSCRRARAERCVSRNPAPAAAIGARAHPDEAAREVEGRGDLQALLWRPSAPEMPEKAARQAHQQHVALDLEVVEHQVAAEEPQALELDALDVLAQVELQALRDVPAQRRRQQVQHARGRHDAHVAAKSTLWALFEK